MGLSVGHKMSAVFYKLVTQNSKETVKGKEQLVVNAVICLSYVMMDTGVPFQMQIEMVSDLRMIFFYDWEQFVSSNLNVNFECRNQQLCARRSLLHWLRCENENHRGKRNLDTLEVKLSVSKMKVT